jgi:hypothetical protein
MKTGVVAPAPRYVSDTGGPQDWFTEERLHDADDLNVVADPAPWTHSGQAAGPRRSRYAAIPLLCEGAGCTKHRSHLRAVRRQRRDRLHRKRLRWPLLHDHARRATRKAKQNGSVCEPRRRRAHRELRRFDRQRPDRHSKKDVRDDARAQGGNAEAPGPPPRSKKRSEAERVALEVATKTRAGYPGRGMDVLMRAVQPKRTMTDEKKLQEMLRRSAYVSALVWKAKPRGAPWRSATFGESNRSRSLLWQHHAGRCHTIVKSLHFGKTFITL